MSSTDTNDPKFLGGLVDDLLLVWKLMLDPDVPGYLKMLPVAVGLYILSPVDFLPEAVLGPFGLLDDPLAALVGLKAFINFVPKDIVDRYNGSGAGRSTADDSNVVEGEYVESPKDSLHEEIILNPDHKKSA